MSLLEETVKDALPETIGGLAAAAILFGLSRAWRWWSKRIRHSVPDKKADIGVIHYRQGRDSWKSGWVGALARRRAIAAVLILCLPGLFCGLWWPQYWPQVISLAFINIVSHSSVVLAVILCSGSIYLRRRSIRSLELKWRLHELMHYMRDGVSDLFKRTGGKRSKPAGEVPVHEAKHIQQFSEQVTERTKDYFRALTGDETIACAIRLATPIVEGNVRELKYKTIARSEGLTATRKHTSEAISCDRGIPKLFRRVHGSQGILYYYDFPKAIHNEVFCKTKNEDQYSGEVVTMMVAPLNGWDGNSVDLLGLLYITSKTTNSLRVTHVDSVRAVSDSLSSSFVAMLGRLHSLRIKPDFSTSDT